MIDRDTLRKLAQLACEIPSDISAHLSTLHDIVAQYTQPQVIELGVRQAVSTVVLLDAAVDTGGRVWSCDCSEPNGYARLIEGHDAWTFVLGDDLDETIVQQAPSQCDVLFIDTSHLYEQTTRELRTWTSHLAAGGTLLMHDSALAVGDRMPVRDAIDDFIDDDSWCRYEVGVWPGLTVLTRRES